MKLYIKITILLLIFLLIGFLFEIDTKRIPLKLEIGNKVGISGDFDIINFGIIPKGGISKKTININEKGFVHILIYGDIKKFIGISDNNKMMNNGELSLTATIPENENENKYSGELIIKVLKWRGN